MDIPNSSGFGCSTYYSTTKYDLGENSRGTNEASTPGPCHFFFSGHCRAGNRCSHSHNYQTLDSFYNYKHDDRTERTDSRIYIAPAREGSNWTGTVLGPEIAAASSSQYDPVNDSMDLTVSITRDHEAGVALTAELPPTGDLVGVALHGTDRKDFERMAVNVRSHQSSENEQLADSFYNYKHDDCTERTDSRIYIAPAREGSNWTGSVLGPEIAAASSSQYDPVNDSMDLIVSLIRDHEAGVALTSELPPTGDLVGVALHGTDCKDVERMAVNVRSHQSSENEQLADCQEEKQNILKADEIAESEDRTEVANNERDVKADERKEMTGGKSLRAFKFALAEFVKELLSPTWNERKIDKEAYKTVVEKVVNKVIFSVQSIHIPRTQENITNYLAASKPNISKLLQAYIRREKEKAKVKAKANVA